MPEFTIQYLLTVPGAGAATFLLTQYIKQYVPPNKNIDPKAIAGIVALVIQVLLFFYVGNITIGAFLLSIVNVLPVQAAAIGFFENINHKRNIEKRG